MSYKLVDLCFDIPGITLGEQAVLVAICRYADNATHDCFPSRSLIATVARLQERQVQRIIPALIDKGFITRKIGKGRASSQYTVQVTFIKELIGKGDIGTPLQTPDEDEEDSASGDIKTPLPNKPEETLGLLRGDIDANLGETFAPRRGDIDASLYKKNLSGIGYEESVHAIGYKAPSAREAAKKDALALVDELNTLTPGALGDLAKQIACRHPRSRMRMWTEANVGQADSVAILDAMALEAQQTGVTMAEAGRAMLSFLEAWDDIPQDRWQYAAAIPKFFKQGDYRLQPSELPGINPQEGKKPHGTRSSSRSADGNDEVIRKLLEESGQQGGGDPELNSATGGDVRQGSLGGPGEGHSGESGGDDSGGDCAGVQPGAGRVSIFPRPSYPPRIQWPRRNG